MRETAFVNPTLVSRRAFLAGAAGSMLGVAALPAGGASIDPIRIAIVGCGRRGTWLARCAASCQGAAIVAACDPSPTAIASMHAIAPAAPQRSWADVVTRGDVDAVVLAVPEWQRATMMVEALEHGKHVWSEAPVAMSPGAVARVERAAAAAGRVAQLAAHGPFLEHWRLAEQVIAGGAIGDITRVQSHLRTLGLPEFIPPRTHGQDWRLERSHSLGPAAEALHRQLTSMASVISIASDAPLTVAGGRLEWLGEQADSLLVELRSESGILVIVTASPGAQPDYVHVRGTLGELTFER